MRNDVHMKNDLVHFLNELGIAWKYLINGFIGAFIWSIYRKSKFVEGLRQVLIGSFISGYFTPVLAARLDLTLELLGFTSFIVGMLGMVIVDSIYKYAVDKIKKWKDALIIINKN